MISRKSLYYQALFKILFSLHLVVISLLWWQNSASLLLIGGAEAIISLARLLGLLGGTAIMLQLLFIGRIAFIEKAFGFDHLNQWHRWIGYSILIFFLGHFFLLLYGYGLLNNTGMWQQLLFYLQTGDYFNAFASLLLFLFIISISLPFTRRRMRYEVWHGFHLLLYVALFLSIDHQTLAGDLSLGHPMQYWLVMSYGIFGLFLLYRWIRPLYLTYIFGFYVEKVIQENENVYSIYIRGKDLSRFHFEAGQFAQFIFLQKGLWYPHPFSFSSAYNGKCIRITAKMSGDFTNRLSELKSGTKIIIDGPAGHFTRINSHHRKMLFIAGGIGITPFVSMAEEMKFGTRDAVLLYSVKTQKDLVFKQEFDHMDMRSFIFISEGDAGEYYNGRINIDVIQNLVPDLRDRDVYICGPDLMMTSLSRELQKLGMSRDQIHFERFAF